MYTKIKLLILLALVSIQAFGQKPIDLRPFAKTASPAFTGTPTAPTPTLLDNSTKLATTAWVNANQNTQWFNVKRYGATGNDATDDTGGINAAIAAAIANGGGVVYFPKGNYRTTGFSWSASGIILKGDGTSSAIRMTSATGNTVTIGSSSQAFKPEITDLHFYPTVTRTSGMEIFAQSTTLLHIDNVMFSNVHTAMKIGNSTSDSPWGKITRIQAYGYTRMIWLIRTIDFILDNFSTQAQNNAATSMHIDGGNDGMIVSNIGMVNGTADANTNNTGTALLLQMSDYTGRPPRYCKFNSVYVDTHKFGVRAVDGYGIDFLSLFGSNRPGNTIVLGSNTKWFTFNGGSAVSSGEDGVIIDGLGHTFTGFNNLSGGFSATGKAGFVLKSTSRLTRLINCNIGNSDDGYFAGDYAYGVLIESGCESYVIDGCGFFGLKTDAVSGHTAATNKIYSASQNVITGLGTIVSATFAGTTTISSYVPEIGAWDSFTNPSLSVTGGRLVFSGATTGEYGPLKNTLANTEMTATVNITTGGILIYDIRRVGSALTFIRFQVERLNSTTVRVIINQFVSGTVTALIGGLGYQDVALSGDFTYKVRAIGTALTFTVGSTAISATTTVNQAGDQYFFQYGNSVGQGANIDSFLLTNQ